MIPTSIFGARYLVSLVTSRFSGRLRIARNKAVLQTPPCPATPTLKNDAFRFQLKVCSEGLDSLFLISLTMTVQVTQMFVAYVITPSTRGLIWIGYIGLYQYYVSLIEQHGIRPDIRKKDEFLTFSDAFYSQILSNDDRRLLSDGNCCIVSV